MARQTKSAYGSIMFVIAAFAIQSATAGRMLYQSATINYAGIYTIGDSITQGFNADDGSLTCSNGDQPANAWATGYSGSLVCPTSTSSVYSYGERAMCGSSAGTITRIASKAVTGGRLVTDIYNQAVSVKGDIVNYERTGVRNKVLIFIGHNDYCSGTAAKTATCSDPDRNGTLYCTMKPTAVDRELRRAMDVLVTVPNLSIVLAPPIRVGQMCNFGSKTSRTLGFSCKSFWGLANTIGGVGICLPLTAGSSVNACTNTRVQDSYTILNSYRTVIRQVADAYATSGAGIGVTTSYSDMTWNTKVKDSSWLSGCDCFHPSKTGQNGLAQYAFNGLSCSSTSPCCKLPGGNVPLLDAARCVSKALQTSGATYAGI